MRWLAQQFAERNKLNVQVELAGTKRRLPSQVETILFRIAQEGLNNVGRHAHAQNATVRLEFAEEAVTLKIKTTAAGSRWGRCSAPAGPPRRGGCSAFRSAWGWVGGQFNIDSAPGRGTELTVRVPVSPDREGAVVQD